MSDLRWIWLVATKDLRIEVRSGGRFMAMVAFVVLAGFLFSFSIDRTQVAGRSLVSGLIWLTILFASTVGVGRTFDLEEDDDAFRHLLLSPISRPALFLGKAAANLLLVWATTVLAFVALVAFLGVPTTGPVTWHLAIFMPGTIGLVAIGTFFSRVSSHSALGDTLLPVLTFPLLVPLIFFGSTASTRVFLERPWTEISGPVRLLWAIAIGAVAVSSGLFRYVVED